MSVIVKSGLIKVTSLPPPLPDLQMTTAVHRVKLKALDKTDPEVKILPFTNRIQIGINSLMFHPITELCSTVTNNQPLLTPGDMQLGG